MALPGEEGGRRKKQDFVATQKGKNMDCINIDLRLHFNLAINSINISEQKNELIYSKGRHKIYNQSQINLRSEVDLLTQVKAKKKMYKIEFSLLTNFCWKSRNKKKEGRRYQFFQYYDYYWLDPLFNISFR